jgi:hypothetical protein
LKSWCLFGEIWTGAKAEDAEDEADEEDEKEEDEEEEMRLRKSLQKNPRMPPAIKGHPLRVFTGFYIESMSNFQAAQMVIPLFHPNLNIFLPEFRR